MHSALLAGLKSARLGTVTACLMAALMPLSSVRAQVTSQPGGRQRATPDLMALILYLPPINLHHSANQSPAFKLCAVVDQSAVGTVYATRVLYAYQHRRGFSQQVELVLNTQPLQACRTIEGLEIGEYVDVTLTVDPANTTVESNESNNILTLRVTR